MIADKFRTHSLKEILAEEFIVPESAGSKWAGVRHGDLVLAAKEEIESRGFQTVSFKGHVWFYDLRISGCLIFDKPEVNKHVKFCFGFNSSNNSDSVVSFYLGGIFEKTPFVVDSWKGSRYTTNYDLKGEIRTACDTWEGNLSDVPFYLKTMRTNKVGNWPRVLVECGRQKLVPWSRVGQMDKVFRSYHADSMWATQRAFSEVNAVGGPPQQMDRLLGFHKLALKFLERSKA